MDKVIGKQIMLELGELLDTAHIPFFLMQGTCLGAVRDGGFVPTEKDIDFGFLQENMNMASDSLVPILTRKGYDLELVVAPFTRVRTIVAIKQGIKVDMVSFSRWKDKRFASTPIRDWLKEPYCIVHEAELLENYDIVAMFGREWYVPQHPSLYLEREYGPDWKVPKEDHISRTRIYDYLNKEKIPNDLLDRH